jgi:ankyrin repeat protein
MAASGFGGVAVATELLKAGASPEARLPHGETALDIAKAKDQAAAVALLEKARPSFKPD